MPAGAYDPAARKGWVASSGSFTYVDKTGASDVYKIVLRANPRVAGQYSVRIKSRNGDYASEPANLPVHAIVVLASSVAATEQCGEWRFPATPPARPACTASATGNVVRCR